VTIQVKAAAEAVEAFFFAAIFINHSKEKIVEN